MDSAFEGLKWFCCIVYLDDIIIFSRCFEEHLKHLEFVFDRIHKKNLTVQGSKSEFFRKELVYLGYKIIPMGYDKSNDKSSLKSFLGICGFYWKFIAKFSKLTKRLYELIKEN